MSEGKGGGGAIPICATRQTPIFWLTRLGLLIISQDRIVSCRIHFHQFFLSDCLETGMLRINLPSSVDGERAC